LPRRGTPRQRPSSRHLRALPGPASAPVNNPRVCLFAHLGRKTPGRHSARGASHVSKRAHRRTCAPRSHTLDPNRAQTRALAAHAHACALAGQPKRALAAPVGPGEPPGAPSPAAIARVSHGLDTACRANRLRQPWHGGLARAAHAEQGASRTRRHRALSWRWPPCAQTRASRLEARHGLPPGRWLARRRTRGARQGALFVTKPCHWQPSIRRTDGVSPPRSRSAACAGRPGPPRFEPRAGGGKAGDLAGASSHPTQFSPPRPLTHRAKV
jgi:hypothetical protein